MDILTALRSNTRYSLQADGSKSEFLTKNITPKKKENTSDVIGYGISQPWVMGPVSKFILFFPTKASPKLMMGSLPNNPKNWENWFPDRFRWPVSREALYVIFETDTTRIHKYQGDFFLLRRCLGIMPGWWCIMPEIAASAML